MRATQATMRVCWLREVKRDASGQAAHRHGALLIVGSLPRLQMEEKTTELLQSTSRGERVARELRHGRRRATLSTELSRT